MKGLAHDGCGAALTGTPGRLAPALAAFGERGVPKSPGLFIWLKCYEYRLTAEAAPDAT